MIMCQKCGSPSADQRSELPRRNFLKLAGAAAFGIAFADHVLAAANEAPPKPRNVISPDAALARLMKGNERYVKGVMKRHDFFNERPALSLGQNPFVGILSCADSRVARRGDVFVCRVAGNFANADTVASFEYAVAVLGTPLILVLGHSKCGALEATVKAVKDGEKFSGHIPSLITALRPAVKTAMDESGDLLENAIKQNVLRTVEKLKGAGPILSKAVEKGTLRVAGGVYDLYTGRVGIMV